MSYRDETLVLRERLLMHEATHAKLLGQADGLAFRIAELETEEDQVDAEIEKGDSRRSAARSIGRIFGVLVLSVAALGSVWVFHIVTSVSASISASQVLVTGEGVDCTVEVDDRFLRDTRVIVTCGDDTIYAGECACQDDANGLECWDHGQERSFVMAETFGVAVVRRSGEVHRLALHFP